MTCDSMMALRRMRFHRGCVSSRLVCRTTRHSARNERSEWRRRIHASGGEWLDSPCDMDSATPPAAARRMTGIFRRSGGDCFPGMTPHPIRGGAADALESGFLLRLIAFARKPVILRGMSAANGVAESMLQAASGSTVVVSWPCCAWPPPELCCAKFRAPTCATTPPFAALPRIAP